MKSALIVAVVALAAVASANPIPLIIEEEFADWESLGYGDPGTSVYMEHQEDGGNPGGCALAAVALPPLTSGTLLMWSPLATADPSLDGILWLDLQIDTRSLSSQGEGQWFDLLVIQDDWYYVAGHTATGTETSWQSLWVGPFDEEDFTAIYPVATGSHPDFSFDGSLVTLGLCVSGTTGAAFAYEQLYDNWAVAIAPRTDVPESGEDDVGPRILGSHPNPFRDAATIEYVLPLDAGGGHAVLTIHDVAGRRVRVLERVPTSPGVHTVTWDGTDDAGADVAAGVYFCRLGTSVGGALGRLVLLE